MFFIVQRSPKFTVRGIQTMIEGYSLPNKKLTPHMFRHTFCKWMLKATNNDIEKVDGWLVIAILRQLVDI